MNPQQPTPPPPTPELLQQLQALLLQSQPAPSPFAAPTFQQPTSPAAGFFGGAARPVGLLVAVKIPMPDGEASCYLQLGPEAAANPQAAIAQLTAAGWPVRTYGGNNGGPRYGGSRYGGGRGRSW